jgi:CHAD domain-containing protein
MSKTKPCEILNLSCKQDLITSAKKILSQRLDQLLSSINIYFSEKNIENLHQLRISLRRMRYPMELFIKCFNRKKYLSFYKIISSLQNSSGEVRDLDIFKKNLSNYLKKDKFKLECAFHDKLDVKRNKLQSNFKLELMEFIHGKELKDFRKLINHRI